MSAVLFRRSRHQRGLLGAILAIALLGSLLFTILPALSGAATRHGAEHVLASSDARARTAVVSATLDSDAVSRAPVIASRLDKLFPAATVDLTSSGRSSSLSIPASGGVGKSIVFETRADPSGITVVDGAWTGAEAASTSAGSIVATAVQVDAARALGLRVGDRFVAGAEGAQRTLRVAALWRASNPAAPQWGGDSLAASGSDAGETGPFLVSPGDLAALPVAITWTWSVAATAGALADPAAVLAPLDSMALEVHRGGVPSAQQVSTDGNLAATLQALSSARAASALLISIALSLITVLLGVFAAQLGGLLALARQPETDLLRARGTSLTQIVALSLVETLCVSVPAAAVGVIGGAGIVRLVYPADPFAPLESILGGVAVMVGLVLLLAGTAWRGARPAARSGSRKSVLTTAILAAASAVAAGITVWRLRSVGQPLTPTTGAPVVDPLAALSPIVVVIAGGLLTALVLGPLSSLIARSAARRASLGPALAGRSVGRRHGVFAGPAFAIAVVVAATGFAAALAPTWQRIDALSGEVVVGPTARLAANGDTAVSPAGFPLTSASAAKAQGVHAATTVLSDTAQSGQSTLSLIGIAADRIGPILGHGRDAAVLARTLAPKAVPGLALPEGSRALAVRVEVAALAESGQVTTLLWVIDEQGSVAQLTTATASGTTSVASGGTAVLRAELPAGSKHWRLLAAASRLSADSPDGSAVADVRVTLSDLTSETPHSAADPTPFSTSFHAPASAAGIIVPAGPRAPAVVPVTVTPGVTSTLGVRVGSRIDLGLASTGQSVPARVVGIVDHVPGSGSDLAAAVDLRALVASSVERGLAVPNPNEVWVAAAESPHLLDSLAGASTVSGSITSRQAASLMPVVRPAITAFWIAAGVAGALAVLAVGAAGMSLLVSRRSETGILRSLGVPGRTQARGRAVELGAVVLLGVIGGIATGLVVGAIAAVPFGSAAVPGLPVAVDLGPTLAVGAWAVAILGLVLAGVVLIAAIASAVAHSARSARAEDGSE